MRAARAPYFAYKNGELHCEEIPLEKLAKQYGTPLYVYSSAAVRQRVADYRAALDGGVYELCFAVKSNSNLSFLRLLDQLGVGFDVVSGGELARVLHVNPEAASRTVYSGVGKSAAEIDLALKAGIHFFNLESEAELELVASRAARLRTRCRVSFRVNPNVDAGTHPYITTGLRENKFGVDIDKAPELYRRAASHDWLEPIAVSAHIGSQIMDVAPFAEAAQRLAALAKLLLAEGMNIVYLDCGGGLGVDYSVNSNKDFARRAKLYARALRSAVEGTDLRLMVEPGRSISASAGVLVSTALYAKHNENKQFLIVDAAMNDLIRPSLYSAYHEILPVVQKPKRNEDAIEGRMDIVGPICESGDFLAKDRWMPPMASGDRLAVLDAGAYGMTLSSNYNTRPRAAEVMVEKGRVKLIRRRETIDDLIRNEL